jgi:hypothetical protein
LTKRTFKWSVQSNFAGPSDQHRGWEKREASLVYPEKMVAAPSRLY